MHIVPTLLCQSTAELAAGLSRWSGVVSMVQIDFADGVFVPNHLPEPDELASVTTNLQLECHLMVQRPAEWVVALLSNPAVATILVHVEAEADVWALSQQVRETGRQFGLAVRSETALEKVTQYLPHLDQMLLLGVNPGFNGSPFLPEVIDKVHQLRQIWPTGVIEVDGGMQPQTVRQVVEAGADQVAVGSFLQTGDPRQKLSELEAAVSR